MNKSVSSKKCTICASDKELSEFYKNKQSPDGLQSHCKPCNKLKDQKPVNRLSRLKAQCKRYGMDADITVAQYAYLVEKTCHYCGADLAGTTGAALDRIDRDKGYSFENVVQCCWLCNSVKGSCFDKWEMEQIGALFDGFRDRRAKLKLSPLSGPDRSKKANKTAKYWEAKEQTKERIPWKPVREKHRKTNESV